MAPKSNPALKGVVAPSTPRKPQSRAALNPLEAASPALAGLPQPKTVPFLDGVRVITVKEAGGADLVGSDVSLCGYLGIADIKALRELHSLIQPFLNRLADMIKQGYEKEVTGKGPAKTQIEVGKLFGYISKQNDVDISGFDPGTCPWPLPTDGNTFHAVHRPFLYWVKTLYDILAGGYGVDVSTRAPQGDPAERDGAHVYWGFAAEDWHRAFYLVKNYLKKASKKASRQGDHAGASKPQNNKAVPVRYYAPPNAATPQTPAAQSTPAKSPGMRNLKNAEFDFIEDPAQVQKIDEELAVHQALPVEQRTEIENQRLLAFEEKLDKLSLARDAHKTANSLINLRPPLSYTEQVTTIKSLVHPRRTPVQWPPQATPETLVATNQEKENGVQAAREGLQAQPEYYDLTRSIAYVADIMQEANLILDDEKAYKEVETIQSYISTISAIPPSYEVLCQALGLDLKYPRAPGVHPATDVYYDKHPNAVQFLKPH